MRISSVGNGLKSYWKQKGHNMTTIEDDPVIGRFFDTPEKKARWVSRLKFAYIIWIIFMIMGIISLLLWYLLK